MRYSAGTLLLVVTAACSDPARLTQGTGSIRVTGGDAQVGVLGRPLADSIEVTVTDFGGHPVGRVPVQWASADGTIAWGGVTDSAGRARASWTLGLSGGTQHARATVLGLEPVGFSATGTGLTAVQIAGGGLHACALTAEAALYCWRYSGYAGADTMTAPDTLPVRVDAGLRFVQLAAGGAHTCGLEASGTLYCWGRNEHGQLGDGTLVSRTTPGAVIGGPYRAAFSGTGSAATCAIDVAGAAWCWGFRSAIPTLVGGPTFRSLAVGIRHICGVAMAGGAYCWGVPTSALGIGPINGRSTDAPTPIPGFTFATVSVGDFQSCGVAAFHLYCWGVSTDGSLGIIPDRDVDVPTEVARTALFTDVSVGVGPTYARDQQGTGYWWGSICCDIFGPNVPTVLPGRVTLDTIVAAASGACGLTAVAHTVICWTTDPRGNSLGLRPAGLSVSPAPPALSTRAAPERSPPAFPSRSRR
jgi:hypothetical protein